MLKLKKNNVKIILFFMLITSCSYLKKQLKKEVEYIYPPVNQFPSIMTEIESDGNPALLLKLKPESIYISCNLRNDSPYYWCSLEGEVEKPDPKLPKKVFSVYHTVMPEKGKLASLQLYKRLRKTKKTVFVILAIGVSIDKDDNDISGQFLGLFTDIECMHVFGDYSLCPRSSKILNIHSGKYINREELKQ